MTHSVRNMLQSTFIFAGIFVAIIVSILGVTVSVAQAQIVIDDSELGQAKQKLQRAVEATKQKNAESSSTSQKTQANPPSQTPNQNNQSHRLFKFWSANAPAPTFTYKAPSPAFVDYFYSSVMTSPPLLPQQNSTTSLHCDSLRTGSTARYSTSASADYTRPYWEDRVLGNAQLFAIPAEQGTVMAIDFVTLSSQGQTQLGFRYYANSLDYDTPVEPLKIADVFAITGTLSKARMAGASTNSLLGDQHVLALFEQTLTRTKKTSSSVVSHPITTYFADIAERDYLTSLLKERWLLAKNPQNVLRGFTSAAPYTPSNESWLALNSQTLHTVPYRLPLVINDEVTNPSEQQNRLTPLVMVEWFKRLVTHDRVAQTAFPILTDSDIQGIFYGQKAFKPIHHGGRTGGLQSNTGNIVHAALAEAIQGAPVNRPKTVLDNNTRGAWRIWQTTDWQADLQTQSSRAVVLTHICLPNYQGGREFTVFAEAKYQHSDDLYSTTINNIKVQNATPEVTQQRLQNHAAIKLKQILTEVFGQLLQVEP